MPETKRGGLAPAARRNNKGIQYTALRAARARAIAGAALIDDGLAEMARDQLLAAIWSLETALGEEEAEAVAVERVN